MVGLKKSERVVQAGAQTEAIVIVVVSFGNGFRIVDGAIQRECIVDLIAETDVAVHQVFGKTGIRICSRGSAAFVACIKHGVNKVKTAGPRQTRGDAIVTC